MIRNGQDPSMIPLPVQNTTKLIHRSKYHKYCADHSKQIGDTAKPNHYIDKSKW